MSPCRCLIQDDRGAFARISYRTRRRAPPRSTSFPVGGRDIEGRRDRPSETGIMKTPSKCTGTFPCKRISPPLGRDHVPAARCIFEWRQSSFRASSASGYVHPPFISLFVSSSTGIFMQVRHEYEMERMIAAQNRFPEKSVHARLVVAQKPPISLGLGSAASRRRRLLPM